LRSVTRTVLALLSIVPTLACGHRTESSAPATPAPLAVRLATAERVSSAARTEIAGTVEADRVAAVSSRVMALVTAVAVRLGDTVRAGQTLVEIDPTAADGQVAQASGALAQAQAALTLAARNHERFQALADQHAASELELDLARTQHEQAQGAVEQARGALAAARSVARESRVVAPFAGRIARRMIEVGDLAAPGRPLLQVESERGRRLVAAVPETVARNAGIALGQQLPMAFDARPDLGEVPGEVVEISPGPDPATHAFTVKLEIARTDVPAGSAGRVWIAGRDRDAVLVPREAPIQAGGLDLIVVRDAQGQAASRVVTLGAERPDGRVEVLSGLDGGESVALGLAAAPTAGTPLEEIHP
jgi:membrane fusion protein, multidrug efflux system